MTNNEQTLLPFAEKVIQKLQRCHECFADDQGTDIGRPWLDTLTHLGLLERVQRSPALWQISDRGDEVIEWANTRAAQAVAAGLPEIVNPWKGNKEYLFAAPLADGFDDGVKATKEAFTAWLSKAAQGLPEIKQYPSQATYPDACEYAAACGEAFGHNLAVKACTQVVAGMAARNAELEAEVGRLKDNLVKHRKALREEMSDAFRYQQERDTLRAKNAELETALKYAVSQVPELGTVPGIAAALADEAPKS